ncbi:ATP-binding protein [Streptomyces malaysiense]|uniref:ATP-binding protein n=1 Tax=Streptomyces malaysiense TaxID=1428626 RepID=A0A1J4PTK6_9ACTN|nr:ATP-binding protein [Streptomyces malaysiense]OIK23303.1 ATP-binding protein [Streptomyces malaysiense]
MRTGAVLDGTGACIARARRLALDFLDEARNERGIPVTDRARDLTRLVVSELVTNATKYAPGPVRFGLRIAGGLVEIVVQDSDPTPPTARAANPARVGQHGLEIVLAVVTSFEAVPEPTGKRLTARIALLPGNGG